MRLIVATAVGVLCVVALAHRSSAMLIIESNASYLSVDSGPLVPVAATGFHSLVGTSETAQLDLSIFTGGNRPAIDAVGFLTSDGGTVDGAVVLDVEFTSDRAQPFAVNWRNVAGATAHLSISYPTYDVERSYSSDIRDGGSLEPGVHYHLTAEITGVTGGFYMVLQAPEPSMALVGLIALGLVLRRKLLPT